MAKSGNKKIMTPECRVSFLHVLRTTTNLNGDEEYSVDLLLPKERTRELLPMKKDYEALVRSVFGKKRLPKRPFSFKAGTGKPIWKDGDERYEEATEESKSMYEAYRGHVYMKLTREEAKGVPPVLDEDGTEIMDASDFQSGDYGRALVNMSAYTQKKWGPMVSVRLLGIQKLRAGEPLGEGAEDRDAIMAQFVDGYDDYEAEDDDDLI